MTDTPAPTAARRTRQALGAGAWTMAGRVVSQAVQFAIFVVAARLLGPAEFGVFALVSACAILLLRASEVGWEPFIMSWSGGALVPRQVLFISILSGLVFGTLCGLAGLAVSVLGAEPWIGALVASFGLWIVLATVSAAQRGVLIWQNRLKSLAGCDIAGELVCLVVSLAALHAGHGVFALVYGRLAMQAAYLAMSFAASRLSPLPGLSGQVLRDLWVFSGQIFVTRMIINLRLHAATFIIGGFLGPAAVGYFRAADRLVSAVAEVITVPAQVLAWSLFRQARDAAPQPAGGPRDLSGFQVQANAFYKTVTAVAVPVFAWLIVMGEEIVTGLLSDDWAPAAPLVAILALSRILFIPGMAVEPIMSLAGEARRLPVFTGALFAVSILLTLGAAWLGLYAVAWCQVLIALGFFVANGWLFKRHAQIDWRQVMRATGSLVPPLLLGVATLVLLDRLPLAEVLPDLARALGFALVAAAVYGAALAATDPALLERLRRGGRA